MPCPSSCSCSSACLRPGTTRAGRSTRPRDCGRLSLGVPAPPGSIGLLAVVLNLFFAAYFIVIIVLAQARGVSSGEIGIMAAMFGVGGILGALAAPYLQRRVTPYVSIVTVLWALTAVTPLA